MFWLTFISLFTASCVYLLSMIKGCTYNVFSRNHANINIYNHDTHTSVYISKSNDKTVRCLKIVEMILENKYKNNQYFTNHGREGDMTPHR